MATNTDITTMQHLAEHYGGKCLSKEYIDEHSSLEWMCEKGHRWESPYKVVNQGGWCMQCLKAKKNREASLEKMKAHAISKGGKCLSTEYIDMNHKMDWQCAEGHTWSVSPTPVYYQGTWCRKCSYKKNGENARATIELMREIALKKGGKCLSENYGTGSERLEWECSEGHRWKTTPSMIRSGRWCRLCANKQKGINARDTIDIYQKIAEDNGGKLLSETYSGNRVKMLWECSKGHQWMENAFNIKRSEHWCPECAGILPLTLDDMKKDAAKKGGLCLSDTYINSSTKLKWKCSEGHTWMATPSDVRSGRWCRICAIKRRAENSKDSLELFQEIAKKNGGKCLSTKYENNNVKLEFECAKGHIWKATPNSIKNQQSWCRVCSFKEVAVMQRTPLEVYQKIAEERGGKCLTTEFVNNKSKLEWECDKGHRWKATGDGVKQGHWCFVCAHKRIGELQKDTIEMYREIAISRGGKCISTEYINHTTKLEFECAEGHRWTQAPSTVKLLGGWCAICKANEKKKNKIQ